MYGVFNSKDEVLYDLLQNQHKCFPGEIFADMTSMDLSVSKANVKAVCATGGWMMWGWWNEYLLAVVCVVVCG